MRSLRGDPEFLAISKASCAPPRSLPSFLSQAAGTVNRCVCAGENRSSEGPWARSQFAPVVFWGFGLYGSDNAIVGPKGVE